MLDLERRQVFGLSDEAAALLAALAEPCDLARLTALLAAGGATERATAVGLAGVLGELCFAGLVLGGDVGDQRAPPDRPRAILWREQLEEVTQQISPPMQVGNPQCLQ